MSKRHHLVAFVLLSSSAALASPGPAPATTTSVRATATALTDDDGYPLVGNMHGKVADDDRDDQARATAVNRRAETRAGQRLAQLFPELDATWLASAEPLPRPEGTSLPGDNTACALAIRLAANAR